MLELHTILELIFAHAYAQEFNSGNIPKDKMLEISKISYYLSPAVYDKNENIVKPTKIKISIC